MVKVVVAVLWTNIISPASILRVSLQIGATWASIKHIIAPIMHRVWRATIYLLLTGAITVIIFNFVVIKYLLCSIVLLNSNKYKLTASKVSG